jgi:hypothetical protein
MLWLFGFMQVPLFALEVFSIGANIITLNDILIFFVVLWLIDILPSPFRQIVSVMFLLWVLAALGIIAITGFDTILHLAIIVGLIAYITQILTASTDAHITHTHKV